MGGQQVGFFCNLQDQFPCGGDNQHPRCTGGSFSLNGICQHARQDRNQKSGGLSGAGLGPTESIPALEAVRQDFRLYGGAVLKTGVGNSMQYRIRQPQVVKPGLALLRGGRKHFRRPGNGRLFLRICRFGH